MVGLSQAWAEDYIGRHPGRMISVNGGGSGTGIASFIAGTCQIANVSRPLSDDEVIRCRQAGREPKMVVCGMDGLAVVVNSANPIKRLSIEQIGAIFRGEVTDWGQIGGKPGKILCFSRDTSSGTHAFFLEHVLRGGKPKGPERYAPEVLMLPSTQAIAEQVAVTRPGIGYGGEAYFRDRNDLRMLAISAGPKKPYYSPTEVNVITRRYPISRDLCMLVDARPTQAVKEFLAYCTSYEGQCVVRHTGYVPLPIPLPPAGKKGLKR